MFIVLFSFCVSIDAMSEEYGNVTRLSIVSKNVALVQIFKSIEQQSEFLFNYMDSDVCDIIARVNIHNGTIHEILAQALKNTNLTYSINERHIAIFRNHKPQQSPVKIITGFVSDANGLPIIGANIAEKGSANGITTGIDGRFTLTVADKAVLIVSYIGYNTQEIVVGNKSHLQIILVERTLDIEEIVVVGYGTQRKSDITGSISVTTASDLLAKPQFNALDGLKGKAAGVNILSATGNPLGLNGSMSRIIIRGMNSLYTSSDPLFVVDGVQMSDFHYLNPNDIERIEVLKDASATAIYGARGANGVILVSTKRGSSDEGRTTVAYNGYINIGTLAKKVELMNAAEFVEMEDIAFANLIKYPAGRKTLADKGITEWMPRRSDPLFFDANGNPIYDTDWQDAVTRDAISHNHQLNIQFRNQTAAFGAFLNYSDQEGIMLNNYAKRINAKLACDAKPQKWLDINVNLLVNHTWGNTIDDTGGGARRNMWEMPPIIPVKFNDGRWGVTNYQTQLDYNLEGMANPVQELETAIRNRNHTKIFGNLAIIVHLADGLDIRTQLGVDYNIGTNKDYFPTDLLYVSAPQGRAFLSNTTGMYWQEETWLSYNKTLREIHRLNVTSGMSWSESNTFSFNTGNVANFSSDRFQYNNLGAGATPSAPGSNSSGWAINSYFVRAGYTLKDKYMATATLRMDGSSRFGANHKYGLFPSVGLGWNIAGEDILKNIPWLNNMKLHASFGRTGNTEIDVYRSISMMSAGTTLLNGERAPTSQMSRMANPDLEWEKTDQFDAGINLILFNGKISLDMDFYHKNTHDLLLERPLPFETGFAGVYQNMGRVDNTGIDLLLTTINVETKNYAWATTLNFNHNKNEIKKLGENNEDIIISAGIGDGQIIQRIGYPLGSFYAQKRIGTWSVAEAEEAAKAPGVQSPGEAKKTADRYILGNGIPKYSGSLINRLNYHQLDLTIDLQFVAGVKTWEAYCGAILDRAGVANGLRMMLTDGWREDRQNTMVQQIRHTTLAGQSSNADSYWISDGSYLRGNLLQLGYTFNSKQLGKRGITGLRLSISVSNAFLIHSGTFRGYDPESSTNTGKWGQNIYFYQYPGERDYALGASISF
ncbi:MAG: TonB-dependent receptor [Tannerellaceae bacterium]|jgi:TonB-linked SusC/RagA family outer membrane protein|nr:TonB-dependent receptor [Tannerellaceae bacterium]